MKSKTLTFLIILSCLLTTGSVLAQNITNLQREFLKQKAPDLVKSYNQILQQIVKKDLPNFKKNILMKDLYGKWDVKIPNIISIDDTERYLTIAKFIEVLENDYSAGIILEATFNEKSNIGIGHIVDAEYALYAAIPITLKIIGIYKEKQIIRNEKRLYLIYRFSKKGSKELHKFEFTSLEKDNKLYPLLNYKYYGIGITSGYEKSILENNNGAAYNIEKNNASSIKFGVSCYYSFSNMIGMNVGLQYKMTSYNLIWANVDNNVYLTNGESQISTESPEIFSTSTNSFMLDKDNDRMLPFVNSNGIIDSRKMTSLVMPIDLELKYEKMDKYTGYMFGGLNLSYKLTTDINAKGEFTTKGYYPDYDFTLSDLPDYGFETQEIDTKYVVKNGRFNVGFYGGFGIRFYLLDAIAADLKAYVATDSDKFYNENNNSDMHVFSPEYTNKQLLSNQLKSQPGLGDESPWINTPNIKSYNVGANLTLFYKF